MWNIVWHCTKHPSYDILWGLLSTGWLFYCGWKSASINFNSVFKSSRSCLVGTTAKLEAGSLVLEHCKPTSYERWDVKGWTSDGASSRGKVKKGAKPFLLLKKKKKNTVPLLLYAVLGKQHDSKMERFLYTHPLCCPTQPKLPAHKVGSTFRATEKNKTIHSCFTSGAAKPQPLHSCLLTLSGLRHTTSMFSAKTWWAEEKLF